MPTTARASSRPRISRRESPATHETSTRSLAPSISPSRLLTQRPTSLGSARRRTSPSSAVTVSALPTAVTTNRRPLDYDWHVGGRTKELRTRVLARKFFFLWQRRIFGRVTPSAADRFYRRKIVKRCARVWIHSWWTARKEWKLQFRADYHFRFAAASRALKAWRLWTIESKEKKRLAQMAESHRDRKAMVASMRAWKHFIVARKKKKKMLAGLEAKSRLLRQKLCFERWRREIETMKIRKIDSSAAVEYHHTFLVRRYYAAWSHLFKWRRKRKFDWESAVRHHRENLLRRCVQSGLLAYVARRRSKTDDKQRAIGFSTKNIQSRIFQTWLTRLYLRRRWLQRVDRASALACVVTQRRVLLHWLRYVDLRRLKAQKWELAVANRRKRLLRVGVETLKSNAEYMRAKASRVEIATRLWRLTTAKNAWVTWQNRLESKEEARLYYVTRQTLEWRRLALLRKGFKSLRRNVRETKEKMRKERMAEVHFLETKVASILYSWRRFAIETREKRERKTLALSFYVERRDTACFATWRKSYFRAEKLQRKVVDFQRRCEQSAVKDVFSAWRLKTSLTLELEDKMAMAADYYHRKWICKCYAALKSESLEGKNARMKEEIAVSFARQKVLAKALVEWKRYVRIERRGLLEKVEKMRSRCFYKRGLFQKWKEFTEEAKKMAVAARHRETAVGRKALTAWKRHVAEKKRKRKEDEEKIAVVTNRVRLHYLRAHFNHWWSSTTELGAERECVLLALDIHRQKLARGAFEALRANVVHQRRFRRLNLLADGFLKERVTSIWFRRWRRATEHEREESRKTVSAIYIWALRLQWKALAAWKDYVAIRREKKREEEEAREKNRFLLTREGVRVLVSSAATLRQIRSSTSAEMKLRKGLKDEEIARNVVRRWKDFARRKKSPGLRKNDGVFTDANRRITETVARSGGATKEGENTTTTLTPNTSVRPTTEPLMDNDINVAFKERRRPRCPDFMLELMDRSGRPLPLTRTGSVTTTASTQFLGALQNQRLPTLNNTKNNNNNNNNNNNVQSSLVLLPPSFFIGANSDATIARVSDKENCHDEEEWNKGKKKEGNNFNVASNANDARKKEKQVETLLPFSGTAKNNNNNNNNKSNEGLAAEIKTLKSDLDRLLQKKNLLNKLECNLTEQKRILSERNEKEKNASHDGDLDTVQIGRPGDDFLMAAIRETEKNVSTLKSWMEFEASRVQILRDRIQSLASRVMRD